jgi:hypothetical protein
LLLFRALGPRFAIQCGPGVDQRKMSQLCVEMFSEPPPLAHVRELMPAALGPLTAASRTLLQEF